MGDNLILYGAGGHAASVVDALLASGRKPLFILDDDPGKNGRQVLGIIVRGRQEELSAGTFQSCSVLVALAVNGDRKRLALELAGGGTKLAGVVHPSAIVSQHASVHPTAQILAGVIVNAGAVVHAHAVLNTGCIIEHDATVGEFSHVGPGAVLAGAVVVEEGAFVATGAKVCPFVRLGSWSTLGAGAVALRDVPSRCVAVGVPAKPLRKEARA